MASKSKVQPKKDRTVGPGSIPHPLNGDFAYFTSVIHIEVGPETTYELDGRTYVGRFNFTGYYGLPVSTPEGGEVFYKYPIVGGTLNTLTLDPRQPPGPLNTGYEIAWVQFSPEVKPEDPTYGTGLSRFVDSWVGWSGIDPLTMGVSILQVRYINTTFVPVDDSSAKTAKKSKRSAGEEEDERIQAAVNRLSLAGDTHLLASANWGSGPRDKTGLTPRMPWNAFQWLPTWTSYGARSYTRVGSGIGSPQPR